MREALANPIVGVISLVSSEEGGRERGVEGGREGEGGREEGGRRKEVEGGRRGREGGRRRKKERGRDGRMEGESEERNDIHNILCIKCTKINKLNSKTNNPLVCILRRKKLCVHIY